MKKMMLAQTTLRSMMMMRVPKSLKTPNQQINQTRIVRPTAMLMSTMAALMTVPVTKLVAKKWQVHNA